MSATSDDGLDLAIERSWKSAMREDARARKPRPRCACGRVRRAKATKCQQCLDVRNVVQLLPDRHDAREMRGVGFVVAFFDGSVHVAVRSSFWATGIVLVSPIDGGRWMSRTDLLDRSQWALADARAFVRMKAIASSCYCATCATGCDFCNGTRSPAP